MPSVQIVPGSLVPHAAYAGAEADVGSAAAPGMALARVGQQVGNEASGVLERFAVQKQQVTNAADLMTAQLQMENAHADYQAQLSRNPDPSTWVDGWQKQAEKLKTAVLTDKLAPVVRDQLANQLNNFTTTTALQVKTQANAEDIRQQKDKMMLVANTAWDGGQFEKGEYAVDAMQKNGLISDVKATELKQKGQSQATIANVAIDSAKDPIIALDDLNAVDKNGDPTFYKALNPNERAVLVNKTEAAVNKVRTDTLQGLYDRQNGGEILKAVDLQPLVDSQKLNAGQMKAILAQQASQRNKLVPPSAEAFMKVSRVIDTYDPAADAHNGFALKFWITDQMAGMPEVYRSEVGKAFDRRVNSTGESQKTSDAFSYLSHVVSLGTLGNVKQDAGGPVDQKGAEEAYFRESTIRGELTRAVQASPNMSNEDQLKFIASKIKTYNVQASGLPVLNALSGTSNAAAAPAVPFITSEDQFNALPSGSSFFYKGRAGTKK